MTEKQSMTADEIIRDQWRTAGNCRYCRRVSYCKKQCAQNKQRLNAYVANAMDHDVSVQYVKSKKRESRS